MFTACRSAIRPRDRRVKMSDDDYAALVRWWETGTADGIPRNVIRRLKAARYVVLSAPGRLELSLAGQRAAAFRSGR